jgi:metal-sulfur cluster biosynthetic enzyme
MNNEFLQTEEAIVAMLKTVYDPEIPVNVYDLGLIYKVDIDEEKNVRIPPRTVRRPISYWKMSV